MQNSIYDSLSKLPNRAHFLELAQGEFLRSRRYNLQLSLIVSKIIKADIDCDEKTNEVLPQMLVWLGNSLAASSRQGCDILGHVANDMLALLLPQTFLAEALICCQRHQLFIEKNFIMLHSGKMVKAIVNNKVETKIIDDERFMDIFARATSSCH